MGKLDNFNQKIITNQEWLKRNRKQIETPDGFADMGLNQEKLRYKTLRKLDGMYPESNWVSRIKEVVASSLRVSYVNRFQHNNIPFKNITGNKIEQLLYERGYLGIFYSSEIGFIISAVAFSGEDEMPVVDMNNNPSYAHPVPWNGTTDILDPKSKLDMYMIGRRRCVWEIEEEATLLQGKDLIDYLESICIIMYDRQPVFGASPFVASHGDIPFVEGIIESIQLNRSAMINSLGVSLVQVSNQEEADQLNLQMRTMQSKVLHGQRFFPIKSLHSIEDITPNVKVDMQAFWSNYQSIKNLRDTMYGIRNDGVMQQSGVYQNENSQQMDLANSDSILLDGYLARMNAYFLMNVLFGTMCTVDAPGITMPGAGDQQTQQGGDSNDEVSEV